jgi:rhodanese-related sulfurtransferase
MAFCAHNSLKTYNMKRLIALVLTVAGLSAFSVYAGEYADITIKELKADLAAKKVTLLDANGTESWEKGHIPGAINFETSQKDLAKVLPKDKNALVVAYCGNPKCKAYQAAAKAAEKLGYTNVKHLPAGIQGWKEAGETTEAGK